uniref:Small ribosomal subunit protein bS16c n=1 Tax=Platysiphonia delicata TaxID=2006979 RepID=A0A1Z1M0U6_9FLOR|nr:ribosomal protein S16 [Platysiphonia delicata]ARW59686.1 ribosomal protein S16 [Platysiphonia delicata]
MLKIRLKRLGKKKKACYRIIIIDSRYKRDGKALSQVGHYDPINKNIKINPLIIKKRIAQGAQMTNTVKNILKKTEI